MRLYFTIINRLLLITGVYLVISQYVGSLNCVKRFVLVNTIKGFLSNWL